MPADLDDARLVEDDDLVGVADRREPVRDRDRRRPCREPVERLLDEPLGLRVERRSSPRRGRGSAGCAGSSARSRSAASRRPRSGSRARRRPCRSPRAARRSGGGCAPPRAASSISSSVASGFAKRRFSRDRGVEQVRLLRDDADEVGQRLEGQVADVDAADRDRAALDVVEPRGEVGERRLARSRSRRRGPSSSRPAP